MRILSLMSTASSRLGTLVRQRREALGLYTVVDAAKHADISRDTWAKVEAGEPAKPVTYKKIEAGLGWAPGTIAEILAGGDVEVHAGQISDDVTIPRAAEAPTKLAANAGSIRFCRP